MISDPIGCYLDSDIFIDYLHGPGGDAKQSERYRASKVIIENAENGVILMYTSVLTEAEVHSQATGVIPDTTYLDEFFDSNWINSVNVTRNIARYARDLIWDNPSLRKGPNDAIHLASALRIRNVKFFYTRDAGLLNLKSKMERHRFGRIPIKQP